MAVLMYGEPVHRLTDPYASGLRPQREAHVKVGYVVALRLGDPTMQAVVTVAKTEHTNREGQMLLTRCAYELVQVEHMGLRATIDRLKEIVDKAKLRAEEGLGDLVIVCDVTRQPQAYTMIHEKVQATVYVMITTHGRLMASTPYWLVGRVTAMSYLNTQIARDLTRFLSPPIDDPRFWTPGQVREALAKTQAKPPKMDSDEYLTDTVTEDDVVLACALGGMYAELSGPTPWLPDPSEIPVRFAV